MRFTGQDIEVMTIIAIESEVGGYPCISPLVLNDIMYKAIGKALLDADVFYFPVALGMEVGVVKQKK